MRKVKLIIQIPCYNEEHTLPQTVADIPRQIEGIDEVRIMIIDDGSKDRTVEIAKQVGVDYIIRNKHNRGLARTFRAGMDACLKLGADIIVNTDGDNQYAGWGHSQTGETHCRGQGGHRRGRSADPQGGPFLVREENASEARQHRGQAVVGDQHSRRGERLPAISRDAALQLNIISPFSYTIEMLIQAGKKHMAITSVPIETNPKTRESRLFKSIPKFIERSLTTMVRMYAMYQPLRVFFLIGLILSVIGATPVIRFLYFYFTGAGDGHIQSLVIGGVFLLMGFMAFLIGLIADLINFNRQLIEMTLERVRKLELELIEHKVLKEDELNDAHRILGNLRHG
jgi:glycosyltransferase involved in cell wall biosynthesis